MTIGHIILGLDPNDLFYIALAFIICGFGYFENNIAGLVNELYTENHPKRDDNGFVILDAEANIGAALGLIFCDFVANYYG